MILRVSGNDGISAEAGLFLWSMNNAYAHFDLLYREGTGPSGVQIMRRILPELMYNMSPSFGAVSMLDRVNPAPHRRMALGNVDLNTWISHTVANALEIRGLPLGRKGCVG